MLDQLTNGGFYEFPSFEVALFSILLSFVLSSLIGFSYQVTSHSAALSRNFIQAMVLSSIVSCMVIMAVGNNIAAGFGILGAIAVIRFRMRVENPRNIIFIFAALSTGIATGVYGYSIAIAGTGVFCAVTFLLYFSPYGSQRLNREFNLSIMVLKETAGSALEDYLTSVCIDFRMLSMTSRGRGDRFEYFVTLKPEMDKEVFFNNLKEHEGFDGIRMERSDNLTQL